jgi:hypothetical protein
MALSPVRSEILQILAQKGGIGLTGNKESYSHINREGPLWVRIDGDSMTGEQTETQIDDDTVLRAVFWKTREQLGHYGPDDGAVTWDDVLAWLRDGGS